MGNKYYKDKMVSIEDRDLRQEMEEFWLTVDKMCECTWFTPIKIYRLLNWTTKKINKKELGKLNACLIKYEYVPWFFKTRINKK